MSVAQNAIEHNQSSRLNLDPAMFAANFDKRGFHIEHQLADHPLLKLPAIAALSRRLPASLLEWNAEQDGAFTEPNKLRPHHMSCADTILNLESQPARVLLLSIENDPQYKKLMDELLDQIEPLTQKSHPGMVQRQAFIFLSSKAAYTPFHFDPDYNFLLQVRGHKTIFMWDPQDRYVLPASSIDSYYAGASANPNYANRDQKYRDEFMHRAWRLPMSAGQGVHFPLHAPHAVKTESDVSISLSVTFRTERSQKGAIVHGANWHARRLGLTPPQPGSSQVWDTFASVGYRGMRKTVSLLKRS
jgi:Cupin-like domain